MRFVGLIPARAGSKGIPQKNIAPCAGKPLLAWTCEAALASRSLARTILSTDSEAIAEVGRACGVEVPFLRPAELATDDTPSVEVMRHAWKWLSAKGESADALVLLQPTSPLRTARHIDEALVLFESAQADTVVSVVRVPHRFHPRSLMREEGGVLLPYEGRGTTTRRQELPPLWARNGPAILVVASAILPRGLYGPRTLGYRMSACDSIDVNEPDDLAMASFILRERGP